MTPERFRTLVSGVLIAGVTASAVLIATGFVGSLLVGWEGSLIGAPAGTEPASDFAAMMADVVALRPVGLAQAGIVLLILTPVARVAASLAAFLLERDRVYAAITAGVLTILLVSLLLLH